MLLSTAGTASGDHIAEVSEERDVYVERSFDERCVMLEEAITKHPLHREIYYKVLCYAMSPRTLEELEKIITQFPEYQHATQNPYHLISVLNDAGGLQRSELDDQGNKISFEQKLGLSEKEIDDLIASYSFKTTDVGQELVDRHAPKARLAELFDIVPSRKATYIALLDFCLGSPRSYTEIEQLLDGSDSLVREFDGHRQIMQASVLVDKLERAGGIVWDKGWVLTDEGKEFLEELKMNEEDKDSILRKEGK